MRIAVLHRYPEADIKSTNAAFPYFLEELRKGKHTVDVLTFKKFDRNKGKLLKSLLWIFYAPLLVIGKRYDRIYCDDSFPFYALGVALAPFSHKKFPVIKRMGDLHLMYYCKGLVYKILHWFEKLEWSVCILLPITKAMEEVTGGAYIPDPVDLDDFPFYEPTGEESTDVMFHGHLNKNKGVEMLLEAARRLPLLKFGIIGTGPALEELRAQAPGNVHFYGWIPYIHMHRYLADCKLGIAIRTNNPGNDYVITQPILQYSAVGRPFCASRRKCLEEPCFGNIDELVEQIDVLINKGSWDGLATAFELRRGLAYSNRKVMENVHDARKVAKLLAAVTVWKPDER